MQLISLTTLQACYQILIIKVKPYENPKENKLCIMNEMLVSIVLYFYIMASDFNEDEDSKLVAGYGILAMLSLSFLTGFANFSFAIFI